MTSPFGKYAQIVAAVVAVGIIAVAAYMHAILGAADPWVDALALIAAGAIFGGSATAIADRPAIEAAHHRLDAIHAPPASNGNGGTK